MVTFNVSDTTGDVLQFSDFVDGYLSQSPVAAGVSFDLGIGTNGSFKFPVTAVSASLSYIEFEDSTRFGTGADALYAKLTKERQQAVTYARSLVTRMEQGTLASEIATGLASLGSDEPGVKTAKMILRSVAEQKGVAALSQEAHRIAAIPLPAQ